MTETVIMTNVDCSYFEGFYESLLYNSDTEYYFNQEREEGKPECELKDFAGFSEAVAKHAVYEIVSELRFNDTPLKSIDYVGIDSPQYYNFTTDKLKMKVKYDSKSLKSYMRKHESEFADYLYDHFTSYDGFISFVANNPHEFYLQMQEGESERQRGLEIMIDFIIQNELGESGCEDVRFNTADYAREALYEYMEPVSESESETDSTGVKI